jgi:hypothetical protein
MVEGLVNCGFLLIIGNAAYGFRRSGNPIFQLTGKLLAGLSGGGIVG